MAVVTNRLNGGGAIGTGCADGEGPQRERTTRAENVRTCVWSHAETQVEAVGPARQMLKKLLAAPLRVKPYRQDGARGWEVSGRGNLGKLLSGLVAANMVASPLGKLERVPVVGGLLPVAARPHQ